jgi:Zn-dependent protease with chaperone function
LVWLLGFAFEWLVLPVHDFLVEIGMDSEGAASGIQTFGTIAVFVGAFASYGWVSRRFERQADVASACDLSGPDENLAAPTSGTTVTPRAAALMCGALESVAVLNGLDPERNTWRHGSIRWRQQCLLRSIGQPVDQLPIDAQVRCIKAVTAIVLAALILFSIADVASFGSVDFLQE